MKSGYDPSPLKERPFHDDYAGKPYSNEDGRLAESIEGVKLDAPFVAGRRRLGGSDEGIPAESWHEVASGLAGNVRRGDTGKDLGRYLRGHAPEGQDRTILVSNKATEAETPRIAFHEIGHAIDDLAREIPQDGLSKELARVYADLNNPLGRQGGPVRGFSPVTLGYAKKDAPAERMAEAIRAYMVDPNYRKSVAPKAAERIRRYVNENPRIAKTIQFNSLAAAAGGLGYGLSQSEYERAEEVMGDM